MKNKDTVIDSALERTINVPATRETIHKIVSEKLEKKLHPKALAAKIEQKIDNAWETMVMKMLGFDNRWHGQWEVTNNNSSTGKLLKLKAQDAVDHFMERAAETLPKVELTSKYVDAMIKTYNKEVKSLLQRRVKDKAEQDVESFLNNQFQEAIDLVSSPEAEAVHALRETVRQTKDPAVKAVLETSLAVLEAEAFKKLS